jgi:hypothetical protein
MSSFWAGPAVLALAVLACASSEPPPSEAQPSATDDEVVGAVALAGEQAITAASATSPSTVRTAGIAFEVPPGWSTDVAVDYAIAWSPTGAKMLPDIRCAARRMRTAFPVTSSYERAGKEFEVRRRIVELMVGNHTTASAVWCGLPIGDASSAAVVDALLASVRTDASTPAMLPVAPRVEQTDVCVSSEARTGALVFVLGHAGDVRSGVIEDGSVLRQLDLPAKVRQLRCSYRFAVLLLDDGRVFSAAEEVRDLGVTAVTVTAGLGIDAARGFFEIPTEVGVVEYDRASLSAPQVASARALVGNRDNGCIVEASGHLRCWADEMYGNPLVEFRGDPEFSANDHADFPRYRPERITRLVEAPAELRGLYLRGGRVCALVEGRWRCVGEEQAVDEFPDCHAQKCVCRGTTRWRCDDTAPEVGEWPMPQPALSDVIAHDDSCALTDDGRLQCLLDRGGVANIAVR